MIRVRETMAAAEIQGSEPHFLGLKDFGFSKSADEAFKFWGHDEALRRMVLQIRQLRPDVIITNHSVTTATTAIIRRRRGWKLEAFDAAADPKRFPEQVERWRDDLAGATSLRARRFRRWRKRTAAGPGRGLVTIDPNEQDPIRGTTYAEQAFAALQKHATQGPWPKTVADMARFRNSARWQTAAYSLSAYARNQRRRSRCPAVRTRSWKGCVCRRRLKESLTARAKDGRPLIETIERSRAKLFART